MSVFVKPWRRQCCAYASLANTGVIGGLRENKTEFIIMCLLVMLICTSYKLGFAGAAQINPKLVNITVLT